MTPRLPRNPATDWRWWLGLVLLLTASIALAWVCVQSGFDAASSSFVGMLPFVPFIWWNRGSAQPRSADTH